MFHEEGPVENPESYSVEDWTAHFQQEDEGAARGLRGLVRALLGTGLEKRGEIVEKIDKSGEEAHSEWKGLRYFTALSEGALQKLSSALDIIIDH